MRDLLAQRLRRGSKDLRHAERLGEIARNAEVDRLDERHDDCYASVEKQFESGVAASRLAILDAKTPPRPEPPDLPSVASSPSRS